MLLKIVLKKLSWKNWVEMVNARTCFGYLMYIKESFSCNEFNSSDFDNYMIFNIEE